MLSEEPLQARRHKQFLVRAPDDRERSLSLPNRFTNPEYRGNAFSLWLVGPLGRSEYYEAKNVTFRESNPDSTVIQSVATETINAKWFRCFFFVIGAIQMCFH